MAKFKKLITTNQGREMINNSISTSNFITFTKISSSTSIYTDDEIPKLTSLSNIKQTVDITRVSKIDDTSVEIEATINNTDLKEAYTLNSIGLYAFFNGAEKLFAVASVESIDKGSYIPIYDNKVPTGMYIKLYVTTDFVDNITYNIDPTGYATFSDIKRLEEKIPKNTSQLENTSGYLTNKETYLKEEIDNKISSIYKFKGSVANKDDLPTTGLNAGDTYNLLDTGMNTAWTGTSWDDLGVTVDLTDYAKKADMISIVYLTQSDYDSLETKDSKTIYVITD